MPTQSPNADQFPLHRAPFRPIRNINSVSEALKNCEREPHGSRGIYGHDTASLKAESSHGRKVPKNAFRIETVFALDDLILEGSGDPALTKREAVILGKV